MFKSIVKIAGIFVFLAPFTANASTSQNINGLKKATSSLLERIKNPRIRRQPSHVERHSPILEKLDKALKDIEVNLLSSSDYLEYASRASRPESQQLYFSQACGSLSLVLGVSQTSLQDSQPFEDYKVIFQEVYFDVDRALNTNGCRVPFCSSCSNKYL